jgi:hypothetical protein
MRAMPSWRGCFINWLRGNQGLARDGGCDIRRWRRIVAQLAFWKRPGRGSEWQILRDSLMSEVPKVVEEIPKAAERTVEDALKGVGHSAEKVFKDLDRFRDPPRGAPELKE